MQSLASTPSPRPRVLAIDDDAAVHRLLKSSLRGERVEVHGASSGEQGLAAAATIHPDVVLVNMHLPDIDGFEVLDRLKSNALTQDIPVIFLSGSHDKAAVVRGLDMGAIDFVAKPFDVSELKARVRCAIRIHMLIRMLAQRAQIDGLTGLWNRAHFDQRLSEEMTLAVRHGSPLAMILCDLDRFKNINDTYGHPFGDRVLEESARLMASGRASDIACRYGGEEFAMILPRATVADAASLAQRVRDAIRAQRWERAPELIVTASFGVADVTQCGGISSTTAKTLLHLADTALYAAKQSGRDRVVVAGEHSSPMRLGA